MTELANLATIASFFVSLISLVISGITLKLAWNISINISKDNNINKNTINNSTITQTKE